MKLHAEWIKIVGLVAAVVGVAYDNINLVSQLVPVAYAGKTVAAIGLVAMIVREVAKKVSQPKEEV